MAITPEWSELTDWMSDVGGFGGSIFTIGDGVSRVMSRYYFMNFVLGMLFLVRRVNDPKDEW